MRHSPLMEALLNGDLNKTAQFIQAGEEVDTTEFLFNAQDAILNGKKTEFQQLLKRLVDRSKELKTTKDKPLDLNSPTDIVLDYLEKKDIKF